MRWTNVLLSIGLVGFVVPGALGAQDVPAKNPLEGNPDAIRAGATMFRDVCAVCHGPDGKGVRGPDLTQLWVSGATDARLFQTIRRGVPGTEMPPSRAPDDSIWGLLAYVRSVSATTPPEEPSGNAENGQRIFRTACRSCHQVNGEGGRLGPDLFRIGASRSRVALKNKIRNPTTYIAKNQGTPIWVSTSTEMPTKYEPVTLVMLDGRRVRGLKKNEDAFSIQIMDTNERIQGFLKANIREIIKEPGTLMPAFTPQRLNDRDLDDLLRYLGTLRGTASSQ